METTGSLIDKLIIVNQKIWVFEDVKRDSQDDHEIAEATRKTNILNQQRNDLIQEINKLILDLLSGKATLKNYDLSSFKKYGK